MNKDVLSGVILLAVAVAYYWATGLIFDSSLSDEVGAQGLPRMLAFLLAGLALLIVGRGLVTARRPQLVADADHDDEKVAATPRALGFLAIAVGYVVVAPLFGFGPALALLIAAIAMYEGMRPSWRLALVAAGGAFVFWLLFVQILGVEQPQSLFF
jgi:putative tricarboxylic transport membrane protein